MEFGLLSPGQMAEIDAILSRDESVIEA
jgi:hypothetical protein